MPKKQTSTSSDILKSLFHRSEKGFFRVLEVRNLLTADERAHLKIKKSSNQKQVLEALGTLAPPYCTVKKGSSFFIVNKTLQASTSNDILKSLFHRTGMGFIPVLKIWNLLNAEEKTLLQINSKSSQKDILKVLGTLATPYSKRKKGHSFFIINKTLQDTLLEYIAQESGKTINQIAKAFPLKQNEVIGEANKLIEQGTVMVQIPPNQKIERKFELKIELHFHLNAQLQSQQAEPVSSKLGGTAISDPVQAFKAAYDHVGPGRHFVEIFKIRRHLGLQRKEFDDLLEKLADEDHIALNPGNPGDMTKEEIQDSFQDEFGDLNITVTWR